MNNDLPTTEMAIAPTNRRIGAIARMRVTALGISPGETRFQRRGFEPAEPDVQHHLERIGQHFVAGYNAALAESRPGRLVTQLNTFADPCRGFAFEGAAMALALLDELTPWNSSRFKAFLQLSNQHAYMLHVGAGWASARVPWIRNNPDSYAGKFDPLLRWLVIDGYGFHQGYFSWRRYLANRTTIKHCRGYAARAFDQGLGRSMWFVYAAEPRRIESAIRAFSESRQSDLWSGVGLACTYAGGVSTSTIHRLCKLAGSLRSHLAQGAAFAAKARTRAKIVTTQTERACEVICGTSANDVAILTDRCLEDLTVEGDAPAYEIWRRRIREELLSETIGA